MTDNWYTDESNFWNARSIFGRNRGLDIPPDRGGFKEHCRTGERVKFVRGILESRAFATWLDEQQAHSDDVYSVNADNVHFRATNNRSYGYTYLWAWEDPT